MRLVYPSPVTLERYVTRDFGSVALTWQLWRGEGALFRSILERKGVFVICYAINDKHSFGVAATQWLPILTKEDAKERLIFLIGLKKDTRVAQVPEEPKEEIPDDLSTSPISSSSASRESVSSSSSSSSTSYFDSNFVSYKEGQQLSADFGVTQFFECSSSDPADAAATIDAIVHTIVHWQPPHEPSSPSCSIQ